MDQRSAHYAKIEIDKIFGQKNFLNEIIWCYQNGGKSKNHFAKKHDSILIYSKTDDYKFNEKDVRIPYELISPNSVTPFNLTDKKGRKYRIRKANGKEYKYYQDAGKIPNDWWIDIQPLTGRHGRDERLGYPTQKPLTLLDRFIKAFTNKNDMVFDAFCGCGTTISSAQNLGRLWMGCDISKDAIKIIRQRMARDHSLKIKVIKTGALTKDNILRLDPFEFERYVVGLIGQPNLKQRGDGGVDGYTYSHIPIQVKKSYKIGRPVLDSFYKHIEKRGAGILIAHSFCSSLIEEKNKIENEKGWTIDLIETRDLIRDAS